MNQYVERAKQELPYLHEFCFARNLASRAAQYQWTVVATFDNEADHERYQVSDVHQQMKADLGPHIVEIVVSDVDTSSRAS
jgi:hypothetical protein